MSQLRRIFSTATGKFRAIPLGRPIALLTTIVLTAVDGGDELIVRHYYGALAERVRDSRAAQAELLAEHAGRAMATVDLSLTTLVEALRARLPLNRPTVFTQLLLDKYVKDLPQVRALFVVNRDGRVVNTSRSFPPPNIDIADRMYFSEQKKWRGVGLYIDRIAISRADGAPFFAMSRPVLDNDGNFDGIIAADVSPEYFQGFYGPRGQDPYEIVALERADGTLLAGMGVSDREPTGDRSAVRERGTANTSIRDVRGFPAKIVVISNPVVTSPQFLNFCAVNVGLLIVMTSIAWWLATAAAREAASVDREARARRTAEARLLRAIDSAPAGFALYDPGDRLVLSNEMYRSMFNRVKDLIVPGVSFDELVRASVAHKVYADIDEDVGGNFARWRLAQHPRGGEETILQLDGRRFIFNPERRTQEGDLVCFFSDITPLKQKEEALRRSEEAEKQARQRAEHADRAKTSFLATMSHELRTTLNAIIGFSEMIKHRIRGPLSDTYQQYAEIIRTSGHHLLSLINDILDIAKLNSGSTELHLEPENARQLLPEP